MPFVENRFKGARRIATYLLMFAFISDSPNTVDETRWTLIVFLRQSRLLNKTRELFKLFFCNILSHLTNIWSIKHSLSYLLLNLELVGNPCVNWFIRRYLYYHNLFICIIITILAMLFGRVHLWRQGHSIQVSFQNWEIFN